ncbi:MAG: hypothetical protein JWM88_2957 [Verrucomicrobia bacterium]|nr:hypothetical protein [Verrucomicrobiota bacterium]
MKISFFRLLLVASALLLAGALPALRAEDLAAVKSRIHARLSTLDSLKASGAVGENNRGLVEVRDGGGEAATVVPAENADREAVYAEIARKTGSTPDAVARARAHKVASESAPGVWLQKDDGSWAKK